MALSADSTEGHSQQHVPGGEDDNDPCDQKLSPREIAKLKRADIDVERLKWELGARPPSRFDLYKCRNGDVVVKRKGDGRGPGEPTGLNINHF